MRNWLVFFVFIVGTVIADGQAPAPEADKVSDLPIPKSLNATMLLGFETITFDFERDQLKPPAWGFEIHLDGVGRYYDRPTISGSDPSTNQWQDITVSAPTMEILKAGAARGDQACESKTKNIAKTGKKTLIYWHGDVPFRCEFNYSDVDGVARAAEAFQSMASTLQVGEELKRRHRYDRLGLDNEIDFLADEVKAGRAIELQNIAPILRSIAEDERVMERARRKAARLLVDAGIPEQNP
jgi:hypothetical protein